MVSASGPWFVRGGNYNNGTNTGVFAFNNGAGINIVSSFRQVQDYKRKEIFAESIIKQNKKKDE